VDPLLLCCIAAMGQPRSSLMCDYCSDEIVATNHFSIAIVDYGSLVQRCIVVVIPHMKNYKSRLETLTGSKRLGSLHMFDRAGN
jgi:hypothetical protein